MDKDKVAKHRFGSGLVDDESLLVLRHELRASISPLYFAFEDPESVSTPIPFRTLLAGSGGSPKRDLLIAPVEKSARSPYQDRISIGRSRNNDIVVRHPAVSKLHAHLLRNDAGGFAIVDLASHNGTTVAGRRIEPNEPALIEAGSTISVGRAVAILVVGRADLERWLPPRDRTQSLQP